MLRSIIAEQDLMMPELAKGMDAAFLDSQGSNWKDFRDAVKAAAIIASIGPIVLIYPFVQRYFVKGVLVGSLRG